MQSRIFIIEGDPSWHKGIQEISVDMRFEVKACETIEEIEELPIKIIYELVLRDIIIKDALRNPLKISNSFKYDVFVSYSRRDENWVLNWLLPKLEEAGFQICIDFRDFVPGANKFSEMERAISQSRKTLMILSHNYLESEWTELESILAQKRDPVAKQRRLLPLLIEPCEIPSIINHIIYLDFTNSQTMNSELKKLIAAIGSKKYLNEKVIH